MTVSGQNAVNYTFDNANRLTQISQSGTGTVGFGYDNADRRTLLTLPNGATEAYVYDNGGLGDSHVTSITYKDGTTTIGNLTYGYDPDGRRISVGGTLAAVAIPRAVSGNIFNAGNEVTTFNGYSLTYDSDGQTLTDTSNTYTWDTRRHLSKSYQTSLGSGYGTDFVYDALGRRVKVTDEAAGTTTQYLYDGLNPVALTTGSAVTNLLTGLSIDEYFSFSNSTGAASLLIDALGSTLALTDSTGAVFSTSTYEPFGRQPVGTIGLSASSPLITIPFEFTGREDDDGTVYYYRARYHNTYLQRFLSQDPLDFAGGDAYAGENPTTYVDRLGLQQAAGSILIYRAVKDPELNDILESGVFQNPYGIESKYFSLSPQGAACYAKQANASWPEEGPYTIVQSSIPEDIITPEMTPAGGTVDTGIPTIAVPTETLPQLSVPVVSSIMPLPTEPAVPIGDFPIP